MKTTLLIMAAGIGSRFGGGIKQLEPVGLHGEIIMDYSIHDATEAGFNKVVFIIRRDIEEAFRERIGDRIEQTCARLGVETAYAFQSMDDLPACAPQIPERKKPWGTGQAVLAAKELIHEPFVVINADDYYGKEAFRAIHAFLEQQHADNELCMAGFVLKNTLSENGGVTRGICRMADGMLTDVVETKNIVKTPTGAAVDGEAVNADSLVSMNMWGLSPAFIDLLKTGFEEFFRSHSLEELKKAEYLLPIYIDQLIKENRAEVKVLPTNETWFGVTFQEDKAAVIEAFAKLVKDGVYKENLYA